MTDHASHPEDAQAQPPRPVDVDPKLLEILICPQTRTVLRYDREHQELISTAAGLAYPIRDGIPIMLVSEARVLEEADPVAPGRAALKANQDNA